MAAVFRDGHTGVLPVAADKVLSSVTYATTDWKWLYRYMKSLRIVEFESPFTRKYGFSVTLDLVLSHIQ